MFCLHCASFVLFLSLPPRSKAANYCRLQILGRNLCIANINLLLTYSVLLLLRFLHYVSTSRNMIVCLVYVLRIKFHVTVKEKTSWTHTCFGSGKVRLLNTKQELRSKDYYTLFKHTTPKEEKSSTPSIGEFNLIWYENFELKSQCQLSARTKRTNPIYQRTIYPLVCSDSIGPCKWAATPSSAYHTRRRGAKLTCSSTAACLLASTPAKYPISLDRNRSTCPPSCKTQT